MTNELLLAGLVREWLEDLLPGEPAAADGAVDVAMRRYAGGASVSDACQDARAFARSWARHPSHQRSRREQALRIDARHRRLHIGRKAEPRPGIARIGGRRCAAPHATGNQNERDQ